MTTLAFVLDGKQFWPGFLLGALAGLVVFGLPAILRKKKREAAEK